MKNKSIIDIAVPISLAGFVGFWLYYKDGKKLNEALLIMAIIFIAVYAITSQVTKFATSWFERPEHVNVKPDVATEIDKDFNPMPWVDRLFKDIDCIFCFRDAELYAQLTTMNNASLTMINNAFNEKYYTRWDQSLVQAMEGEAYGNLATGGNARSVLERLKKIESA